MMKEWTREQIQSIVDVALSASTADHTTIAVHGVREGATRYANSEINQNVVRTDLTVSVQSAFGNCTGQASTNVLQEEALVSCVRRAEDIARLSPPDPEYMPPVEPLTLPEVDTWSETTAHFSPTARATTVKQAIAVADKHGLKGAGALRTISGITAIGNSAGHFAFNKSTDANLTFSATSEDSVGWAESVSRDTTLLKPEEVAKRAVDKALKSRSPREIKPGRYEVILEPSALTGLISIFMWVQMNAKAADEGRTFLCGKKNAKIAASNIHLYSDPEVATCPTRPFDEDGMKLGGVDWIRDGVLTNLIYSRFWAKKMNCAFTGRPSNLIMEGGQTPLEAMIASTRKGLLITRFFYIRVVNPMHDLYTGMTRDGTFLVEKGEIVGPVKNLRFNESTVQLLGRIDAIGQQQNTRSYRGFWRVPYVRANEFNFTSTTRF